MYGWLARRDDILRTPEWFGGVPVRVEAAPTRWEEFTLVRDLLVAEPHGHVLDCGTGFDPTIHLLAQILATIGWAVNAIDLEPRVTELPPHPRIVYETMDMFHLGFRRGAFDVVTCVSVLEHLDASNRQAALAEMARVLRPNGTLVLTADNLKPSVLMSELPGFDFGVEVPTNDQFPHLSPQVSFLVAVKL